MSTSNKPYEAPEWLAKHVAAELTFDLTQTQGNLTTYVMDEPTVSAAIARELGLVTICVLVLTNGWKEVGYSAPVDPKAFNTAEGIDSARINAYDNLAKTLGLTQAFARKDALDVTAGLAESGAALMDTQPDTVSDDGITYTALPYVDNTTDFGMVHGEWRFSYGPRKEEYDPDEARAAVVRCVEEEAEFWGVYQWIDGRNIHVADVASKGAAIAMIKSRMPHLMAAAPNQEDRASHVAAIAGAGAAQAVADFSHSDSNSSDSGSCGGGGE